MKSLSRVGLALVVAGWIAAAAQAGAPPPRGRSDFSDPSLSRLIDLFETRTLPFAAVPFREAPPDGRRLGSAWRGTP